MSYSIEKVNRHFCECVRQEMAIFPLNIQQAMGRHERSASPFSVAGERVPSPSVSQERSSFLRGKSSPSAALSIVSSKLPGRDEKEHQDNRRCIREILERPFSREVASRV